MRKKIIGITGGLASGKTVVADLFTEMGAIKIDADEITHQLLGADKLVKKKVVETFGEEVLTEGKIDRRKLAGKVFFDKDKLNSLCKILHPPIIARIKERAEGIEEGVIVVDAPLLIESGLNDYVDVVVVVAANDDLQIERAISRGITKEEAEKIILNQMPLSEKKRFADFIIENVKDLKTIKEGVERIWQNL